MLDALHHQLAGQLELMPCTCNYAGSWPTFKAEACVSEKSKHKLHTCQRCVVLIGYELRKTVEAANKVGQK